MYVRGYGAWEPKNKSAVKCAVSNPAGATMHR